MKEGVLSEFPLEHCWFGVGSLQLLLAFSSFGGWVIRLESDFDTFLHKCISSKVFGKDRILPSVHARSTNPPVVITHCSLILVDVPTNVCFSTGLVLVWNMVLLTTGGFFFLTGGSVLLSFCSCICWTVLLFKMFFSSGPLHWFTLLYSWNGLSGGSHAGDDPWSKPANCSAGCPSACSLSVDASTWQRRSEMRDYLVKKQGNKILQTTKLLLSAKWLLYAAWFLCTETEDTYGMNWFISLLKNNSLLKLNYFILSENQAKPVSATHKFHEKTNL